MRSTLGSIFGNIIRSQNEFKNGLIHHLPNGWVFSKDGTTNSQGVFIAPKQDVNGKWMSLNLGRKTVVNCPSAELYSDSYPETARGFQVPYSVCRKCEHHLRRCKGRPKPCCNLLRKIRTAAPSPEKTAIDMLGNAVDKANSILKGEPIFDKAKEDDDTAYMEQRRQSLLGIFGHVLLKDK